MKTLLLVLVLTTGQTALAHSRLKPNSAISPRNSDSGLKTGPCGGVARTSTPAAFQGGASVLLQWEETVQHTGSYFIEFSAGGDTNWQRLKTVVDDQDSAATPHQFSTTITIPATSCSDCTIRVVQEMLDNHPTMPTYYYSCGDITINSAVGTPPPPAPPAPSDYGGSTPNCGH